ncbi:hypothetical protein ACIQ4Z_05030 [Peribacillus asahii]|uniref:hypothetical protein n=1 Tax=Peribacillus asahii TaxID=228899 RepID=UPI003812E170
MGKANAIGVDGFGPYSVIFWEKEGIARHKMICYSEEEQNALDRYYTPGDFYNESFDNFEINPVLVEERKGA